jgi:hypothetical protein
MSTVWRIRSVARFTITFVTGGYRSRGETRHAQCHCHSVRTTELVLKNSFFKGLLWEKMKALFRKAIARIMVCVSLSVPALMFVRMGEELPHLAYASLATFLQ